MAIRHLTYLDLTPEQRREGAKGAREQLRQAAASPYLTLEQRAAINERTELIHKWEKGDLEVTPKAPTPKALPMKSALQALPPGPASSTSVDVSWDEPEDAGDRATPIVDISHLASLSRGSEPKQIAEPDPFPSSRKPTHHVVAVEEAVPIEEKVSGSAEKPKAKKKGR